MKSKKEKKVRRPSPTKVPPVLSMVALSNYAKEEAMRWAKTAKKAKGKQKSYAEGCMLAYVSLQGLIQNHIDSDPAMEQCIYDHQKKGFTNDQAIHICQSLKARFSPGGSGRFIGPERESEEKPCPRIRKL